MEGPQPWGGLTIGDCVGGSLIVLVCGLFVLALREGRGWIWIWQISVYFIFVGHSSLNIDLYIEAYMSDLPSLKDTAKNCSPPPCPQSVSTWNCTYLTSTWGKRKLSVGTGSRETGLVRVPSVSSLGSLSLLFLPKNLNNILRSSNKHSYLKALVALLPSLLLIMLTSLTAIIQPRSRTTLLSSSPAIQKLAGSSAKTLLAGKPARESSMKTDVWHWHHGTEQYSQSSAPGPWKQYTPSGFPSGFLQFLCWPSSGKSVVSAQIKQDLPSESVIADPW